MKLTEERLVKMILEELDAMGEGFSGMIRSRDAKRSRGTATLEPGPEMSPEEKIKADAEDTIKKMRMIKRMGLQTMTRIPNEQVKAMVMELAPELKDSILFTYKSFLNKK